MGVLLAALLGACGDQDAGDAPADGHDQDGASDERDGTPEGHTGDGAPGDGAPDHPGDGSPDGQHDGTPGDDGHDGQQGDGAPDVGDGEPDQPVPGAVQRVGAPCAEPLGKACDAHNGTNKLVCLDGVWAFNGSCDGLSRCDTREGATRGTCQGQDPACVGKLPGEPYCDAARNTVVTCGADLLDHADEPCRAHSACDERGDATCACAVSEDGLGGCAKKLGRFWDNGNGTVYDPETGLTWARALTTRFYRADEVYFACDDDNPVDPRAPGSFRLPSIEELETIRVAGQVPAIDTEVFMTPLQDVWTSDVPPGWDSEGRYRFSFDGSEPHVRLITADLGYQLRCVH